jgi:hypothetical protein
MGDGKEAGFLQQLTAAFVALESAESLSTKDFAEACARVLPIFDHIGEQC